MPVFSTCLWDLGRSRQGLLLPPPGLDRLPEVPLPEPTRRERLESENELLGFPVSSHPLELFDNVAWDTYCPVSRLGEHVGEKVTTCGLVVEQRTHHQITGEPMKFLTLADWTGMVETELFAQTYRKNEAARLHALQGKSPMQLVLQRNEREELVHVAHKGGWRVQPELLAAIEDAIRQYHAARAPLYPLSKIKRLGYLDEHDTIECENDLHLYGGGFPRPSSSTRAVPIPSARIPSPSSARPKKPNSVNGNLEDITYSGQELAIYLESDGVEYSFLDSRLRDPKTKVAITKKGDGREIDFTLQELCDSFSIPDVPDVATVNPEGYAKNVAMLEEFERLTGSKLKPFQKEDLARAALHQGLIMGWDTGLGKTWTLFIFPLLKTGYTHVTGKIVPHGPVLVVAPGDLHQQICDEARDRFQIHVTPLDSQDTFNRLCRQPDSPLPKLTAEGRPIIPAGFYITSYTQLTTNNVNKLPDPDKWDPRALLDFLSLKIGDLAVAETEHSLYVSPRISRLAPNPEPERCTGWPDTVTHFFALRAHHLLWAEEYDMFKLDFRFAVRANLDAAYERLLDDLAEWGDRIAAANQRKRIDAALGILSQLVPERIRSRSRMATFPDLTPTQQQFVIKQFCIKKLEDYSFNLSTHRDYPIGPIPDGYHVGKPETDTRLKWRIKCIYNPSLADLSYNAFDAVSIDEGVKMKGEETQVGMGVRFMDPLYRNVATATPIKNRLPDIFRLAWWACGGRLEAHARFPYRDDPAELAAFSRTFLVQAEITGENSEGQSYCRHKVTAEVCNVHRLWKFLGPIILRRRKQDCFEDIVPRVKKIFRCKMGTEQRRVYQYHLDVSYRDRNGNIAIGAQLQALRQAAVAPATPLLNLQHGMPTESCPVCAKGRGKTEFEVPTSERSMARKGRATPRCPRCDGAGVIALPHRAASNYIPKTATVLSLIREIIERGEQVIVFSAFNEPNDHLSRLLGEAGVRHLLLDGKTAQKKRGAAAAIFKAGRQPYLDAKGVAHSPIPVTLAGIDSMAEGHSFHRCSNTILYAYSWAYDKFKQALDRIHRLNSEKPVNVYVVFCDGTIDQRLESLTDEKGDAADLVLDGALMGERTEEVNFAELLKLAQQEFEGENQTVDEAVLQSEWPALRAALANAQSVWDAGLPVAVLPQPITRQPVQTPAPVLVELPATNHVQSSSLSNAWRNRLRDHAARLANSANPH